MRARRVLLKVYLKLMHLWFRAYYRVFKEKRLGKYDTRYFFRKGTPGFKLYQQRCIRPYDMGACLCYAYGCTSYDRAREILCFPPDDPWHIPHDTDFKKQFAAIKKRATRQPKTVVSIGAGRGEMELLILLDGVRCIPIDPSPVAHELCKRTMAEWGGVHEFEFINTGAFEGLRKLQSEGVTPDTIIFCESIEHIPRRELMKTLALAKKMLSRSSGLLIVANNITYHPIMPHRKVWDHATLIDDALYDRISREAKKVIFRQGSHLVLHY
jgi:hypothetical protein